MKHFEPIPGGMEFGTFIQFVEPFGITPRQVHYWSSRGILANGQAHVGPGVHRRYGFRDVQVACILVSLSNLGIASRQTPNLDGAIVKGLLRMVEDGETKFEVEDENTGLSITVDCSAILSLVVASCIHIYQALHGEDTPNDER